MCAREFAFVLAVELLWADDEDNDLWNGTPHYKEICAGARANIGPDRSFAGAQIVSSAAANVL